MKTNLILLAAVAASAAIPVLATPEIANMNLVRDPNTHLVTISYDLSEDAIVTAQVFTNGVALPHAAYGNMGGKVHRTVKQGTGHQIWWNPPTREVDALVDTAARIVSRGINEALNPQLPIEDIMHALA